MTTLSDVDPDVVDRVVLPPDPGLIASLGSHHTLESAIADLIDNSIDAQAKTVRIRFLTSGHRLQAIAVLDSGWGMDGELVNEAMTIGRRRQYMPGSLGKFGLGLKAAGLGCAETITVWSHAHGATPVGRRLRRESLSRDFGCDILASESAIAQTELLERLLATDTGTSVVLDDVHYAYDGPSELEAKKWLSSTIEHVRVHIGVVFHRWIATHGLRIDLEVVETTDREASIPITIRAIDPFGYKSPGYPGYPRTVSTLLGDEAVLNLECHIWPAKNDLNGYRMGGKSGGQFQGFYVYRADRLLQIGGWDTVTIAKPELDLARVVIEDDSIIEKYVKMTPEKQGISFSPHLRQAISKAVSSNGAATTFGGYLSDAENAYRTARRRTRTRRPTIRPAKGFAPNLKRAIGDELEYIDGADPVEILWQRLPDGEFLQIDFPARTVWLNSRYRETLVATRGRLNDAPLIKTLVYLLTRAVFEGDRVGSRDRDNIALWSAVLGSAVREEESWRNRQE